MNHKKQPKSIILSVDDIIKLILLVQNENISYIWRKMCVIFFEFVLIHCDWLFQGDNFWYFGNCLTAILSYKVRFTRDYVK